jgi:hypothetical protein
MGRQELYKGVPFTAVFGLQRSVRDMSYAFAMSAAELDVMESKDTLTEEERSSRMSRASLMILDELEFDANVVTMPLVFAVVVAAFSQFLVGYVFLRSVGPAEDFVIVVDHEMTLNLCPLFAIPRCHSFLSSFPTDTIPVS